MGPQVTRNLVLGIVSVVSWGAAVACLLAFPEYQRLRSPLTSDGRPNAHDPSKDPKLGARLRLSATGEVTFQGAKSGSLALIVAGGSCSSCSRYSFNPESASRWGYDPIVALVRVSPGEIDSVRNRFGGKVIVAEDGDGVMHKRLNATWTPRYFVVDESQSSVWKQDRPGQRIPLAHMVKGGGRRG